VQRGKGEVGWSVAPGKGFYSTLGAHTVGRKAEQPRRRRKKSVETAYGRKFLSGKGPIYSAVGSRQRSEVSSVRKDVERERPTGKNPDSRKWMSEIRRDCSEKPTRVPGNGEPHLTGLYGAKKRGGRDLREAPSIYRKGREKGRTQKGAEFRQGKKGSRRDYAGKSRGGGVWGGGEVGIS